MVVPNMHMRFTVALLASLALIGCSSSPRSQHPASAGVPIALLSSPSQPPPKPVLDASSRVLHLSKSILERDAHPAATNRGPLWLISTRRTMCLFTLLRAGYVCSSAPQTIDHGLALGLVVHPDRPSSRHFVIFGVVRDQLKRVVLKVGGRGCVVVPVRDNAFSYGDARPVWLTQARSCPLESNAGGRVGTRPNAGPPGSVDNRHRRHPAGS